MFKNRLPEAEFGGCDYSESLVSSAIISTGCHGFKHCEAKEISTTPKFDIVMSESVFQYFESHDYGKKVIFTEVDNPEYLNGKYEYK